MYIDHTTIRTKDIEATKSFFMTIFDLKEGKRPEVIEKSIPGYWLYAENNPIVHIIQSASRFQDFNNYGSEAIDHTAFYMNGYDNFKSKLDRLGIVYTAMELEDINEKRIFLHTPAGVLLEAVFRNE
ncbi:VOC family protein [Flavobacterium sp. FlaQc-48]|uniref:VOC family protein n=1 Tax=Flavobacterium sp. FlaQc-48 TaxID=3374181 RepID=UPI003757C019